METRGHFSIILELLRSQEVFFRNLGRDFTYYWLEIEERESPARARELYVELEKTEYHLETFLKHIQLETRCKEVANARAIYESLPRIFTTNIHMVATIALEHAHFELKHFHDAEAAKNILSNYFTAYPYSEELFLGLLDFYVRHVECKEGSKEGKDTAEKFVSVLVTGLQRALENEPHKYPSIARAAKHHLRTYIKSIFLIKNAERRVKDNELKHRRAQESA